MILRGGRFYIRRHVPVDIQAVIGRSEIWRSLKTDSLQLALRRMPSVCADMEREFDRIRLMSGQSIDVMLLPPLFDDQGRGLEPDAITCLTIMSVEMRGTKSDLFGRTRNFNNNR